MGVVSTGNDSSLTYPPPTPPCVQGGESLEVRGPFLGGPALNKASPGSNIEALLAEVLAVAAPHRREGRVASYIPALAEVDPDWRRSRAAFGLAIYTRHVLEQWSRDHPEERVAGLAAIIEAPELVAREKEPFWPNTRFGLVGYTANGRQIRVSWFEDFRLD